MKEKLEMVSFDTVNALTTDSLMEQLGIEKAEANKILWRLFDEGIVDLVPEIDMDRAMELF